MNGSERRTVFVAPPAARAARRRLFTALEAAFPVRFADWAPGRTDGSGLIVVGLPNAVPSPAEFPDNLPVLAVAGEPATPVARRSFTLHDDIGVDRRIRGITLTDRFAADPVEGGAGAVLATSGTAPVWTLTHRPAALHVLRSSLPELDSDEVLYALLSKRQLTAVALVQFLRDVCAPAAWTPAPLRAAFLFDDPNLRWRSYGYIDYARLARHADEHSYHAAMAMIPLDAGRPHGSTVELYRRRADRLSLIVHGNDHTRSELLAARDDGAAQVIAAQALRRIMRFEKRSGLEVDRVMAPPHGLCSQPMTRALGAVGFDALTAIHPLPWTATRPSNPLLAAWRPADFVAGCPVVPRIPLGSTGADIALRAFLDHPIIVYGHHEDVAGGLDALAETAKIINRLGDVQWGSIGKMVTGNAEQRMDGDRLVLRPFTRRIIVSAAPEVTSVKVEPPEDSVDSAALARLIVRDLSDPEGSGRTAAFGEEVAVAPGAARRLEITLHGTADVAPGLVRPPAWRPWPKLRRVATEIRDRTIAQTASRRDDQTTHNPTERESERWAA
jgi:hypothetical protein